MIRLQAPSLNGVTTPSVVFRAVPVRTYWREAMALMGSNNAETGDLTSAQFGPDPERYGSLDDSGVIRTFVALKRGRLVGYSVFFVVPHLHSRSVVQAIQDVVYVRPDCRGLTGYRFLEFIDRELLAVPVDTIYRQVNVNADYSRTLERMGYTKIESGYVRRR